VPVEIYSEGQLEKVDVSNVKKSIIQVIGDVVVLRNDVRNSAITQEGNNESKAVFL